MKICILGAGALGCSIGGVLAMGGSDVILIDRNQPHVDAINGAGLKMRIGDEEKTVKVKAYTSPAGLEPVDLVVILVKSFATRAAIESARNLVGPDTLVMSIQNGLGHEEILAEVVGREHVLAGKTYVGGVFLEPGRIISGYKGKHTYIGELDGRLTPRLQAVVGEFNKADLLTTASTNIMGTMWDKLMVNVAAGALCGITRLPYGWLYKIPEIEEAGVAAVAEAIAVAKANHIRLTSEEPKYYWDLAAEGLPADFKTSMLQSLEKGQMTEIDFINGAVVRWGERSGIPTPVNRTLVACIKGIENWIVSFGNQ
ncbi:ketopantoate reductase family protein [Propionivibrio limicola]|uniref:ketopantoate reductase family protein n=1 Tax=Propionivibrio limicola TaxID=167645 RepID=UPI0012929D79|nr:ketopantoate reductase family protein [Propionivibrio limicola]